MASDERALSMPKLAVLKDEHDEVVEQRGRPYTDDHIRRRQPAQFAPNPDDLAVFGVHIPRGEPTP